MTSCAWNFSSKTIDTIAFFNVNFNEIVASLMRFDRRRQLSIASRLVSLLLTLNFTRRLLVVLSLNIDESCRSTLALSAKDVGEHSIGRFEDSLAQEIDELLRFGRIVAEEVMSIAVDTNQLQCVALATVRHQLPHFTNVVLLDDLSLFGFRHCDASQLALHRRETAIGKTAWLFERERHALFGALHAIAKVTEIFAH